MKPLRVLIASISLSSCVSIDDTKYPSNWPLPLKMSNTCREISGTYYDHPDNDHSGNDAPQISAAHWAFSLGDPATMPDRMTIKPRTIMIYFTEKNTIKIDYAIKGITVSSREFSLFNYKCKSDYIEMEIFNGWGNFGDHEGPAHGHTDELVRLSRTDSDLIVDSISSGTLALLDLVPGVFKHENWYRFSITE